MYIDYNEFRKWFFKNEENLWQDYFKLNETNETNETSEEYFDRRFIEYKNNKKEN